MRKQEAAIYANRRYPMWMSSDKGTGDGVQASKSLTWRDVLQCWEFDCGQHVPPFPNAIAFEHIHVPGPVAAEFVDWCPVNEFEKRKLEVVESQHGWYRDTGKGTLHTIELLWEYQDNAEATALILLGAFLFERSRASRRCPSWVCTL